MKTRHTISFDLDNTLWDVEKIIIQAEQDMRTWMAQHTPDALALYGPEHLGPLREQVVNQYPHKIHDLSFMRIELLFELMLCAGDSESDARSNAQAAFDVFFVGRNRIEFFPGALDTLNQLKQDYRLLALTNGNADIERAGLAHIFDGAANSAEAGAKKPDPAIYRYFLDKFALDPDKVIHVGDNLFDDVHGANAAGLKSVWVNLHSAVRTKEEAQPHAEVASLPELIPVIEQLTQD
ncbi:MAG: HAD family hydrolase [Pseudomonadota bacterium]